MAERVRSNTKAEVVEIVELRLLDIDEVVDGGLVTYREAVDVADDLIGLRTVAHGDEVVVELASLDPLQDRDSHAFLVHLTGLGAGSMADVDDVAVDEEADNDVSRRITEDGLDGDVVEVAGALPRIVGDVDVAWIDAFRTDVVDEVADRGRHRVHMAGGAGDGLGDHSALPVEHAGRQVTGLADRRREGGTDQGEGLFLDDRDEPVPHHLVVEFACGVHEALPSSMRWTSTVPSSCMVATWWEASTVVVCSSTITAGPRTWSPAESEVRSTTAASASTPLIGSYIVRWFGAATSVPFVDNLTGVGASTTDATRTDQLTASMARSSIARPRIPRRPS